MSGMPVTRQQFPLGRNPEQIVITFHIYPVCRVCASLKANPMAFKETADAEPPSVLRSPISQ
jgi:hypothetical protein